MWGEKMRTASSSQQQLCEREASGRGLQSLRVKNLHPSCQSNVRVAKFCMYRLWEHCPNTGHFFRELPEEIHHQTREKTKRGDWIEQTGSQPEEVKDPKTTGVGSSSMGSGQSTQDVSVVLSASSLRRTSDQMLNKGKTWQPFIPSKTKSCAR